MKLSIIHTYKNPDNYKLFQKNLIRGNANIEVLHEIEAENKTEQLINLANKAQSKYLCFCPFDMILVDPIPKLVDIVEQSYKHKETGVLGALGTTRIDHNFACFSDSNSISGKILTAYKTDTIYRESVKVFQNVQNCVAIDDLFFIVTKDLFNIIYKEWYLYRQHFYGVSASLELFLKKYMNRTIEYQIKVLTDSRLNEQFIIDGCTWYNKYKEILPIRLYGRF